MKKNDKIVVTIEDIGVSGEGIGKVDGYTLFVKDALIGDTVEAVITKPKKNYGYAKMLKVLDASPYRVDKKCPVARQCGGCQIQELSYDAQLEFKAKKVYGNLERIGGFDAEFLNQVMEPICGMDNPFYYRNKAQFPIGTEKEGNVVTGFYAGRTHQIIPNMECALGVPVNQRILKIIVDFMNENHISTYDEATQRGLVRHVLIRYGFTTKEIMVCLVVNGDNIPKSEKLVRKLVEIEGMTSITYSINRENTNVIMGKEIRTLWGQSYITDYIGDVKYQISPMSFFQVNPVQTEKLYSLALEYAGLEGNETVWDLYCGIGTISLFLAQKAKKVYGVEIVPQAIDDARNNAKINGIENAEFFVGKAEEVLPEQYEKNSVYADVIVVDPPRKGCDETLLNTIVKMHPERIVYVSCDSATLARDLKYLCENGYELRKVKPVDQFPHTVHVETVVLLSRENHTDSDIKKRAFFENARLLSDTLGITPLMYGSLGLEYLTGENLNADDIDILIPRTFIIEQWLEFKDVLEKNEYILIDEREHTFEKDGIHYSYAQIEELESFADIRLSDIASFNVADVRFKLLSLQQYLKVYTTSAKDGYRVEVREKKDFDKITFIEKQLQN